MSKRSTVYLPDKLQKILASYGDEKSLSGCIATLITRYDKITREACPALSDSEWFLICEALKGDGGLVTGGVDQAGMVWAAISDAAQSALGEKWGVNCRELADKLQHLSLAGRIAVSDVAARFWSLPATQLAEFSLTNSISNFELLSAGAKIE